MRWWGGDAERGDARRLEAFSDGVLAIAITLLILDVHVEQVPGESLAEALAHALPEIVAYSASFLQIGIMWANHHSLFRVVDRVDQLLLLANLLLLGCVSFLPLPTRLVAEHTTGADARTAMLLYGATLTGCSVAFNLIWRLAAGGAARRAARRDQPPVPARRRHPLPGWVRRLPGGHRARPRRALAHGGTDRAARPGLPTRPVPATGLYPTPSRTPSPTPSPTPSRTPGSSRRTARSGRMRHVQ
jgi:uncharacterized membrane protein